MICKSFRGICLDLGLDIGAYRAGPYRGGGGRGGRTPPPPDPPVAYMSNYHVPPAHRFHKYKLRLLYFRMQKLTPYRPIVLLNEIYKKNSGGACPHRSMHADPFSVDTAPMARVPPPPINDPPLPVRACRDITMPKPK